MTQGHNHDQVDPAGHVHLHWAAEGTIKSLLEQGVLVHTTGNNVSGSFKAGRATKKKGNTRTKRAEVKKIQLVPGGTKREISFR